MAGRYSKAEILEKCDEAAADICTFYKQPVVNYKGRTVDTDELCMEVVARWCLENLDAFAGMPVIRREASYNVHHDGATEAATSSRSEERIAMELFRQSRDTGALEHIGKIIDYQTPLKNRREDPAGKIDLLAYDGETLRVLELKDKDSEETILRCILEGYTYWRTVDSDKLISDFEEELGSRPQALVPCPLVFEGGFQHASMRQMLPNLKRVIAKMSGGVFYISQTKPYRITRDEPCMLR